MRLQPLWSPPPAERNGIDGAINGFSQPYFCTIEPADCLCRIAIQVADEVRNKPLQVDAIEMTEGLRLEEEVRRCRYRKLDLG